MKAVVLASGSPRRADLLSTLGISFEVAAPEVDESRRQAEDPAAYVERLARGKAGARASPDVVALGADTVVIQDGGILGKPAHPSEARRMLERLSAETHEVLTGVAVATYESDRLAVDSMVVSARVRFLPLTGAEIDAYLATGEPFDKAGAYALQGTGGALVDWIEGHPSTIIGLPLPATRQLLARAGIPTLA